MTEEFNLSEKIGCCDDSGFDYGDYSEFEKLLKVEDVKEVIKRLKEELKEIYFTADEEMNKTYVSMIELRIDKLAGDKLV